MKLPSKIQMCPARIAAFTLGEMMVTVAIFSLLIIAMTALQLFALRTYTLSATKLVATAGGRKVMNQIRDQVRQAYAVDVGNCASDGSSFTLIATNGQQGNALQVQPTDNTNYFTIFYLDTSTSPSGADTNTYSLKSYTVANGTAQPIQTLASYITNTIVFDAEDFQGNVLSNNLHNRVIKMTLQFYQWEYPIGFIGAQRLNAYDFYQLRTRVTRRSI